MPVAALLNGRSTCLGDRQGVHVGAQRDRRARELAGDDRADAGAGDRARLEAHLPQALADELRGLDLPAGELGVLVKVPAPFDHPGVDRRGAAVDLGGERVGDGRARGTRASRAGGERRRRGRELEREKTGKGKEQGGAVAGRAGHWGRL